MYLVAKIDHQPQNSAVGLHFIRPMALSHALLAALHTMPCSGYDLAKKFDGSVGFFWNASHQQIYRELSKLEEQNYIEVLMLHQANRHDKKVYTVTPVGKDYLREWIAQPSLLAPIKDNLLVKLFAADLVEPSVILRELQYHRAQHLRVLEACKSVQQQSFADVSKLDIQRRYRYLTVRQGIRIETEWLAWCDEAIELLTSSPIEDSKESS
jgi:DNA-binding PadR family transcriptional regulator